MSSASSVHGDSQASNPDAPTGQGPYPSASRRRSVTAKSNHSGSVWEDALSGTPDVLSREPDGASRKSDELADTLDMIQAEISSRVCPSIAEAIMEDSPEAVRPTSLANLAAKEAVTHHQKNDSSIPPPAQESIDAKLLNGRLDLIQYKVGEKFENVANQIREGHAQQQHIVVTADTLVASLQPALTALNISQQKHETVIQTNEQQLAALWKHSQEIMSGNWDLEQLPREQLQAMTAHEERQKNLNRHATNLQQQQWAQQQQMGMFGQTTAQIQQDLAQMRERSRNRTEPPGGAASSTLPTIHEVQPRPIPSMTSHGAPQERRFGPREEAKSAVLQQENVNESRESTNRVGAPSYPPTARNHTAPPMFQKTANPMRGFAPIPRDWFPNMVVGSCPAFAPSTFRSWKREIKLWIAGQPSATTTQLLAKLIHVFPLAVETEALLYMGPTERSPSGGSIATIMDMMDARFGRTDSERSCAWLSAFAEFKRETQENYKDFWARSTRCVAKLEALGMPLGEKVVFNKVIQALRFPEGQLPIALSALETRPGPYSAAALREITIRMYETHKSGADTTEVYATHINLNKANRDSLITLRKMIGTNPGGMSIATIGPRIKKARYRR